MATIEATTTTTTEATPIIKHKSHSNIEIDESARSGLLTQYDNGSELTDVEKKYKCVKYSFIITILILIALAIFTIYYVVKNETSDPIKHEIPNQFLNVTINNTTIQPTSTPTFPNITTNITTIQPTTTPTFSNITTTESHVTSDPLTAKCQTDSCYLLASDILRSINESVDPCNNFYHYVCDGWREQNEWKLLESKQSSTLGQLGNKQKEVFLSMFTENTDHLQKYNAVHKAKMFFDSCYNSEIQQEDIQSERILKEFISMVNFSDFSVDTEAKNQPWTQPIINGFQDAMTWTLRREWQDLFYMNAYDEGMLLMHQQWKMWVNYNETKWRQRMNQTYVPLYQTEFGLTLNKAELIADLVIDFMNNVANITTADATYWDYDELVQYFRNTTIDKVEDLFGNSSILNYKQIMTDLFYCHSQYCVQGILYLEPGIEFFNQLSELIESTSPIVIQYWFLTDILQEFFGYGVDQNVNMDRVDFCFTRTRNEFPFVYGFIINQKMYSSEKYELALNISNRIKYDGVIELMKNVYWLDEESLNNSLLKANRMEMYIGLPPQMKNITQINKFYDENDTVNYVTDSNGFVENYALMKEFDVEINVRTFDGEDIPLHLPWPTFFKSLAFGLWLTGVNAFYVPTKIGYAHGAEKGNWLCMPQTISQNPMFDVEFPMVVNFAAWGLVVGHEITHGFDSSGSMFDWYGNEAEMWTNQTRELYDEEIECFVDQYSNIEVESDIYCNGERTKTENTADVGGMAAALNAFQIYKKEYDNDERRPLLPGLDYTEHQLWWISYARTWCNAFRPGYYNISMYNNVHAPSVARVNGVVQNFPQFADAFNCSIGSPMNPVAKCGCWHDPSY